MKDFTKELKSVFNDITDKIYNMVTTKDDEANNNNFNKLLKDLTQDYPKYLSRFQEIMKVAIEKKDISGENLNTVLILLIIMQISCSSLDGIERFKEERSEKKEKPSKNKRGE